VNSQVKIEITVNEKFLSTEKLFDILNCILNITLLLHANIVSKRF